MSSSLPKEEQSNIQLQWTSNIEISAVLSPAIDFPFTASVPLGLYLNFALSLNSISLNHRQLDEGSSGDPSISNQDVSKRFEVLMRVVEDTVQLHRNDRQVAETTNQIVIRMRFWTNNRNGR